MRISMGKPQWLGALVALACGGQIAGAISFNPNDANSIKAAAAIAAHDMMSYYHGNETGQSPGLLPWPDYYWWEAGAMFLNMVEYWYYTGDASYNNVVQQALLSQVGPKQDYMPPNQAKDEGNDDQVFWAFAAMSAAELKFPDPPAGQPSWLALAQAVFNIQTSRWDTSACGGGLRWQIFPLNAGYDYKNTISTGGFFQLAARLARYTGNDTYAQWANKAYDWMAQSPLITKEWQVYDGSAMDKNCTQADQTYWTYNVGTLLAGSAFMYNYTNGSQIWTDRVSGLLYNGTNVFFVQSAGTNSPEGNAPPNGDIMSEVSCEFPAGQTCNKDQPSFKAYLARWMAITSQLVPFTGDFILPKLRASAVAAAQQCTGQPGGNACGRRWYQTGWDGHTGVGEEMAALSIMTANLVSKVDAPVTSSKGGTSVGDPSAGSSGDGNMVTNPVLTENISTGDKAGAGILTALSLVLILGMTWWIIV